MPKKIFLLIISTIFLSGCEVTYNLNVSETGINEETTILEKNISRFDNNEPAQKIYSNFELIPLPILDSVIPPTPTPGNEGTEIEEEEGIDYYEKNDITNDNQVGMIYTGKFSAKNIASSSIANYGSTTYSVSDDSNHIKIEATGLNRNFEQFTNLDNIIVNITTNLKVKENNADKKNGNTYTWNINSKNSKNKTIKLTIEKSKTIEERTNNIFIQIKNTINNLQNKEMIFICIGLVVVIVLVYVFIKRKSNQSNVL